MKALLLPLVAVAALAGCATYGDPYGHGGHVYPSGSVTYSTGPVYGAPGYAAPGYYGAPGHAAPGYYGAPGYQVPPQRGYRDRDRDGLPHRVDRDRDGDGVPDNYDTRPNNPRYR